MYLKNYASYEVLSFLLNFITLIYYTKNAKLSNATLNKMKNTHT